MTSSNTDVVTVNISGTVIKKIYLAAVGGGTATITMKVKAEGLEGLTRSFKITVQEGPKAQRPTLVSQTTLKEYVYHNSIVVGMKASSTSNLEYELYRSKSPNKGFKKVTVNKPLKLGSAKYYTFEDYTGLKANTKYYYKVRARYTDSYNSNEWSEFSKVQAYWTAPKPISDKKVKYNKTTRQATIPSVKNVAGYVYTAHGVKKLGYNIFGQGVYVGVEKTLTTSKRIFTVKKVRSDMYASYIADVKPYAKHGKYYYVSGYRLTKKLSSFKATKTKKWAN